MQSLDICYISDPKKLLMLSSLLRPPSVKKTLAKCLSIAANGSV